MAKSPTKTQTIRRRKATNESQSGCGRDPSIPLRSTQDDKNSFAFVQDDKDLCHVELDETSHPCAVNRAKKIKILSL